MSEIVKYLQDIEKAVMLLSNIVLIIYSTIMTIKSKQWKDTARFLVKGNVLRNSVTKTIPFKKAEMSAGMRSRINKLEDEVIGEGD